MKQIRIEIIIKKKGNSLARQKKISWSLFLTICSPCAYINHRQGLWDGMATDEEYLVGWTVELRLIRYRYRSPDPDLIPSQNIGLMSPIHAPIWCFYIPLVLTTVVLVAEDVNAKSALWWDNWTDSYRYQIYQCGSNVRTYSRSCVSLSFTVSFWEPSLLSSAACLCFMAGVQADMEPGGRDTDVTPVGDKVGCYVALLHLFVFLETC